MHLESQEMSNDGDAKVGARTGRTVATTYAHQSGGFDGSRGRRGQWSVFWWAMIRWMHIAKTWVIESFQPGGATWVLARADGSSAVASLGAPRATF